MPNQTEGTLAVIEGIVIRFAPKHKSAIPVKRETRLREELEIDSPRMIDIVLELEDRFGITLEDVDLQDAQTVGDVVDVVEQRTAAKNP